MNLKQVIVLFTLCVLINGAWWAAAVQPAIISLGAVLGIGTLDHDVLDVQQPFISKQARLKDLLRGKRRTKVATVQPV